MLSNSPDDPVGYVLSLNLHRRHLTPSQKSMVAARARECYDNAAKERQKASGGDHKKKAVPVNLPEPHADARDAAGKVVGVSGKTVDYATKLKGINGRPGPSAQFLGHPVAAKISKLDI